MPVYPEMSGQKQVVVHEEGVPSPIAASRAWVDNKIALSKNQKLRLAHRELVEIEETDYKGAPTYEDVDGVLQYVAADAKAMPIAEYSDDPGDLSTPDSEFATDQAQMIALDIDLPGRTDGPAMTEGNRWSTAANPNVNIPGDFEEEASSS